MNRRVLAALRSRGADVLSMAEAGRAGTVDAGQLAFALAVDRALLTCNRRDFARLHAEWARTGQEHAGIIIVTNQRRSARAYCGGAAAPPGGPRCRPDAKRTDLSTERVIRFTVGGPVNAPPLHEKDGAGGIR
jgi:hypothetical protein